MVESNRKSADYEKEVEINRRLKRIKELSCYNKLCYKLKKKRAYDRVTWHLRNY